MRSGLKNIAVALLVLFTLSEALAAVTVVVNGSNYTIPQTNEKGWGTNVTSWIQAITANTLQPIGGNFTLTNDVNFGANFGLLSSSYKTRSANIATLGNFRLANTDVINWRNAGNTANYSLGVGTADGILAYGGVDLAGVSLTQTLTNKTISGASNTLTNIPLASAVTGQLPIANGGTGQSTKTLGFDALSPNSTLGDITFFNGTNNARLAGNTTAAKNFLTQTGTGTVSASPAWGPIAVADVPTLNQNTTGTAANITGVALIANGGTGQATKTAAYDALSPNSTLGDIDYFNGTNNVRLAGNTAATTKFLSQLGNGTVSSAPTWLQPACGNLSNAAASCSTDTTVATNITSGTLPAGRLPTPTASTLGGVQSYTAVANQFITSISTAGVPASAQPSFSNLSGNISTSQMNSGTSASASTFWRGDGTWAAPPTNAGRQQVYLSGGNGHGSTNTAIRRFTTAQVNTGTDMTYADSATAGMSVTINTSGVYAISYCDSATAGAATGGISVNGATLNTSIINLTYAQGHRIDQASSGANFITCIAITLYLTAADVVRAHDDANMNFTNDRVVFSIERVL